MNRRKYFSLDARGIVPPAARGAKQNGNRRSRVDITLYGVIRERCGVRGAIVTGVVRFGERSAIMVSARLSPESTYIE